MVGAWKPCQRRLNLDILWLGFLLWYTKLKIDNVTHMIRQLSTGAMSWHLATYKVFLTVRQNNKVAREALTSCGFKLNTFLIDAWSYIMYYTTWGASFNTWTVWKSSSYLINFTITSSVYPKGKNQPTGTYFLSSLWFVNTLV